MLFKTAATAEALRRIALENGILPEQGAKWKTIAKKLMKVTSSKFPSHKSKTQLVDEVIPDRKIFQELATLDRRISFKYPTREISGFVDRKTGDVTLEHIGKRTSTPSNWSSDANRIGFHKHPYFSSHPSKGDLKNQSFWLQYFRDNFNKKINQLQSLVYNADTPAAGITRYSSKIDPKTNKIKEQIDYAYRVNPSRYNLRGLMKLDKNVNPIDADRVSTIAVFKDYPKLLESELKNIAHSNGAREPMHNFPLKPKRQLDEFDAMNRYTRKTRIRKKMLLYDSQINSVAKRKQNELNKIRKWKREL